MIFSKFSCYLFFSFKSKIKKNIRCFLLFSFFIFIRSSKSVPINEIHFLSRHHFFGCCFSVATFVEAELVLTVGSWDCCANTMPSYSTASFAFLPLPLNLLIFCPDSPPAPFDWPPPEQPATCSAAAAAGPPCSGCRAQLCF